jgi:hypothetical protein
MDNEITLKFFPSEITAEAMFDILLQLPANVYIKTFNYMADTIYNRGQQQ